MLLLLRIDLLLFVEKVPKEDSSLAGRHQKSIFTFEQTDMALCAHQGLLAPVSLKMQEEKPQPYQIKKK